MRIVYAGSAEIAVPALQALNAAELAGGAVKIAAVLTNPDAPRRRSGTPLPTAISHAAARLSEARLEAGLPPLAQLKFRRPDEECAAEIGRLQADMLVSFAYGAFFSAAFLDLFPQGGINVHPSLLPRYRGPSPLQAAIYDGAAQSGVSIQRLSERLDAGEILAQEAIALCGAETAASLSEAAARKAAAMLPPLLAALAEGPLPGTAQDEAAASWTALFTKEDGRVDWRRGAAALDAQIRAFTPWPLSWTRHNGVRLYLLAASPFPGIIEGGVPGTALGIDRAAGILIRTGDGILAVRRLQYEAKKALEWKEFLNGARNFLGAVLD
jgi:methionyl-tRNA formyltransferase